jgi:hypothetical protein
MYTNSTGTSGTSTNPTTVSIKAAGKIVATEFDATSDRRIKDVKDISSGPADLATLSQLEVTDFKYKDKVEHGDNLKKGFIAQQVETVYPEAVSKNVGFIPDIYALSQTAAYDSVAHTLTVSIDKAHHLSAGDKVRIITDKSASKEAIVSAVHSGTSFTVKEWNTPVSTVFVFGKQVNDFRTVDYDRIYTLNVSATQELAKKVMALEAENATLKNKDVQHDDVIRTMKAQIDAINERLNMTTGK